MRTLIDRNEGMGGSSRRVLLFDLAMICGALLMAYPLLRLVVRHEVSRQLEAARVDFTHFARDISEVSPAALDAVVEALQTEQAIATSEPDTPEFDDTRDFFTFPPVDRPDPGSRDHRGADRRVDAAGAVH